MRGLGQEGAGQRADQADRGLARQEDGADPAEDGIGDASWAYVVGWLPTGLAIAVAIVLWAAAATATARHLTLVARVRAVQLVLGAVAPVMVTVALATLNFWWSVTQAPLWLVGGLVMLALASVDAWRQIPRAVRRSRRLRAAASGATTVNPSAQRTYGRHRA